MMLDATDYNSPKARFTVILANEKNDAIEAEVSVSANDLEDAEAEAKKELARYIKQCFSDGHSLGLYAHTVYMDKAAAQ